MRSFLVHFWCYKLNFLKTSDENLNLSGQVHEASKAVVALRWLDIFVTRQTPDWSGRRCWYNRTKLELMTEMMKLELVIHSVHVVTCSSVDEGEKILQDFTRNSSKDDHYLLIGDVITVVAIDRQQCTKETTGWDLKHQFKKCLRHSTLWIHRPSFLPVQTISLLFFPCFL